MSDAVAIRVIGLNVVINDILVAGATSLELFQSGTFSADRFVLSMAFSANIGASYYAGLSAALININVLFGAGTGSTLIVGQIDNITIDFSMQLAQLSGRDLSARLIDEEVNQSFANQTASNIATKFALAAGLIPNVFPTKTPVGQYYELAHTRTALGLHTRNATQWDLLAALAEIEAYTLFVTGTTLNFVPRPGPGAPVTLIYGQDLIGLSIDKAVSLVNAKVRVKSWNTRLKMAHQGEQGSGVSTTLIKPNLMPDQVTNIAAAKQAELVAQTNFLRAVMPGETTLSPQTWINLQGTGTAMDGLYIIQAIERRIDPHHGFTQIVEAYANT
jgi:phage protein D